MNAQQFRDHTTKSLDLAVGMFTLACEDPETHEDRFAIALEMVKGCDVRQVGSALSFTCKLLSNFLSPAEVVQARDMLIEKALGAPEDA
jgi:hypothetical protein